MGGLSLFARQVGRRQHGLNSLGFTGAAMLAANPLLLWDAGFQLSFAATLGLIVYATPWSEALENWLGRHLPPQAARKLAGPVSEYFLLTLAAQLTTFPILLYHFQRISWVSLPANLAILPAQPPIMILGGLAVLFGTAWAPLGQFTAYLVWPFTAYTIRMVEWIALFSQAGAVGQVSLIWIFGYYLLLLSVTLFYTPKWKERIPKLKPTLALAGLLVLTVLVWQAALSAPDGELHVYILDAGEGAAVLVQTPQGRYVLIGGGSSPIRQSDSLGRILPLFHRKLDLLVVPATSKRFTASLPETIGRFPPMQTFWAGDPGESTQAEELYTQLYIERIPVNLAADGARVNLGDGVWLEVLSVSEAGISLLLTWQDFSLLLPYDCDLIINASRSFSPGQVSALVISRDAIELAPLEDWFSRFHPELIVVSQQGGEISQVNGDGSELPFLQTDRVGWVHLRTDGISLWASVEDN
jgi:competence protein ComEC